METQENFEPDLGMGVAWAWLHMLSSVTLGVSLTRDLHAIPELIDLGELSFWSGSQNTVQGLAMIAGLKLGITKTDWGARLLLSWLKLIGKGKRSISDALIRVEAIGTKQDIRQKKTIEMYCEENYATALAPAIVCQQMLERKIISRGAFVPPEIIPARDFMERLKEFAVHYSEATEGA